MSTIQLFDDNAWESMKPMSYTRPMAEMICGIFSTRERCEKLFPDSQISYVTQQYLQKLFPYIQSDDNIYINGSWIICDQLAQEITALKDGEGLRKGEILLAFRTQKICKSYAEIEALYSSITWKEKEDNELIVRNMWDIFGLNGSAIESDWSWYINGRQSEELSDNNILIGNKEDLFIEKGASIWASTLNTTTGKIYIGPDAEIMESCSIRGALVMRAHSVLKMGAKIYGPTTIGEYSKVGGEVSNCLFYNYSNKGHDGFLGNSVVGEWCNFGADSNNSNLKNNYDKVKLWSENEGRFVQTGLQFCGLMMADHAKCGINTMFNTGTVIGVSCNIFGSGFPRNFVPSFSWGGPQGYMEYKLSKALETMKIVMARRDVELTPDYQEMIKHVYQITQYQRNY